MFWSRPERVNTSVEFVFRAPLREALNGRRFVVVRVEDGHQLSHLQHFFEFLSQIREFQSGALRPRAMKRRHQRAQPGAVDIADIRQIQHDLLLARRQQAFHSLAERVAFLAEHEAPFEIDYAHAIHFPLGHSQCHVRASSILPM